MLKMNDICSWYNDELRKMVDKLDNEFGDNTLSKERRLAWRNAAYKKECILQKKLSKKMAKALGVQNNSKADLLFEKAKSYCNLFDVYEFRDNYEHLVDLIR